MSKHDSTKLETVKIVMLKGEKGDTGIYDDTEIRGLITAEAQSRASADNSLSLTKADKTEVNALATDKANKNEVNALATDKADKTVVTALSERVSTAENDIDVLDARMDSFASLPSGSTSGNAELVDIRVGANGTTYPSAGDAVRGQVSDIDYHMDKMEDESGEIFDYVELANGTPPNSGNTTAVCFKAKFPVAFGQKIEIFTDRPPTTGYHYVYGNHIYNSSGSNVVANSYPNGKKSILFIDSNWVSINFTLAEIDDNGNYHAIRKTDFANYHVWVKITNDGKPTINDIRDASDNVIPMLRNGSYGNVDNVNALTTFKVFPVNNTRSMQVEYIGELPTDGHIVWTFIGFTSNAKGKTPAQARDAGCYVEQTDVIGDANSRILDITRLLKWNTFANVEYIAIQIYLYDSNNTIVPLRIETDGNVLKFRSFYDTSAKQLIDDLKTILPRESFAYISDGGSFIFRTMPRFRGAGVCDWRISTTQFGLRLAGHSPIGGTFSDLLTQINPSDIYTDNDGVKWVSIRPGYALAFNFDTNQFVTKSIQGSNTFLASELPLLMFWSGQCIGGYLYSRFMDDAYKTKATLFNSSNVLYDIDVEEKATEFTDVISSNADSESFLFFTDPHTYEHNYNETDAEYLQTVIQKYYNSTPTSFVLCGGDWLTSSDSKSEARYKMGLIDASMRAMVNPYYPIFGNHDSNYQGAETLSNGEVINLWFREWGKAYYTFEGANTIFYVFDSQLDWNTEMDAYKWEQIDWFCKSLESENHDHIAIAIHIWTNSGYITDMSAYIAQAVDAYNNKTATELNGVVYDFTNASGRIEFVIAGHEHADGNEIINNSVPVIKTINTWRNSVVCFDLVFADYTARTIDFIRVGNGSNRKFSLDTGLLITS